MLCTSKCRSNPPTSDIYNQHGMLYLHPEMDHGVKTQKTKSKSFGEGGGGGGGGKGENAKVPITMTNF